LTLFKLPLEAISTIWDLGKDDFDLFDDIFYRFQVENMGRIDPRKRKDEDLKDGCFFHSHRDTKADESFCYLDHRATDLTWIEDGVEQKEAAKPSQEKSRENQDELHQSPIKTFPKRKPIIVIYLKR
jgi:hypothetical protein